MPVTARCTVDGATPAALATSWTVMVGLSAITHAMAMRPGNAFTGRLRPSRPILIS